MATLRPDDDVINSATPLENECFGVHPRLYLRAADFDELRKPGRPPRARRILDSLIAVADARAEEACPAADTPGDPRGPGADLASLALAWRLRGDRAYLAAARRYLDGFGAWPAWGTDLMFGHTAHGFAVALDWLWHDLEPAERARHAGVLARQAAVFFDDWRSCRSGAPFHYVWNHHTVPLAGLTAAACALYGEKPGVSAWLNLATEKTRCTAAALGPDGVSAESLAYGAYFAHYALRTLRLLRELAGVDLLADSRWWREYPTALIHHTLPRRYWTRSSTFLMLGDTDGEHWYGPDAACRVCAATFRDPRAQWLADALDESDAFATAGERIITLGAMAPEAPAEPPDSLPLFRHFEDQDLVLMRSGWDGDESVCAFRCGPSMAHSGMRYFRNPVAGGHMHAFAGTFQIFAHGEFVLAPAGYTQKWTRYHNTVLVNGGGQLGESQTWFECLPFRKGHPCPLILAASDGAVAYAAGQCAPAYPDEAGVEVFVRHLLYRRPDTWLIVDVLRTRMPAVFSRLFHTAFPLAPDGGASFAGRGKNACLRLTSLGPGEEAGRTSLQPMLHTGGQVTREAPLLTLENRAPAACAVLTTLIQAGPAGADLSEAGAAAKAAGDAITVTWPDSAGGGETRLRAAGGLADA